MTRFSINRRKVIAAAGTLGLAACTTGTDAPSSHSPLHIKTETEAANEALVQSFCKDWSLCDVEALIPYLADDIFYQISDDLPIINGIDEFRKQMGAFIAKFQSIRWETSRSYTVGRVVLNERIDYFENPEKGKSMKFHIAGNFVIKNDKIIIWKDWNMPQASLDDWQY